MKKLLLLTVMSLFLTTLFAQTSKHSWIVGGTALFFTKHYNTTVSPTGVSPVGRRWTQINFSPDAGYFFSNRFAAGIKLLYAINKLKLLNTPDNHLYKSSIYGVGPFIRYYILAKPRKFNLLVDGSYLYGFQKNKGTAYVDGQPLYSYVEKQPGHAFSISAGPVINFNSSIGFEVLIGYTTSKYASYGENNHAVLAGLGLQVHL